MLQTLRQSLVSGVLVCEQCVAAERGNLFGKQYRAHWGLVEVGCVAVPDSAEVDGFVLLLQHLDNGWEVVETSDKRVLNWVAEVRCARQKGFGLEILVAEEDYLVLEEGSAEFVDEAWVLGQLGQIYIVDLSADGAG